ncbi:hypothetical protein K474DRAFT_1337644 [Panus rudis PR-1116 ss-1]|nr:hypothetical protein K474DRAFT_1337644 [Panus rudis PR-1116 ss-1]
MTTALKGLVNGESMLAEIVVQRYSMEVKRLRGQCSIVQRPSWSCSGRSFHRHSQGRCFLQVHIARIATQRCSVEKLLEMSSPGRSQCQKAVPGALVPLNEGLRIREGLKKEKYASASAIMVGARRTSRVGLCTAVKHRKITPSFPKALEVEVSFAAFEVGTGSMSERFAEPEAARL